MKIRTSFVSNSSSCSFCIYGISIETSRLQEIVDNVMGEGTMEWEEYVDSECNKHDLEWHYPSDYDVVYIGVSWPCIGQDETGRQFLKRVKKGVNQIIPGHAEPFETHEQSWYNG